MSRNYKSPMIKKKSEIDNEKKGQVSIKMCNSASSPFL